MLLICFCSRQARSTELNPVVLTPTFQRGLGADTRSCFMTDRKAEAATSPTRRTAARRAASRRRSGGSVRARAAAAPTHVTADTAAPGQRVPRLSRGSHTVVCVAQHVVFI